MKGRVFKSAGVVFFILICAFSIARYAQETSNEFESKISNVSEQIVHAQERKEVLSNEFKTVKISELVGSVPEKNSLHQSNTDKSSVRKSNRNSPSHTYKSKQATYRKTNSYKKTVNDKNYRYKTSRRLIFSNDNYYNNLKTKTSTKSYSNSYKRSGSSYNGSSSQPSYGITNSEHVYVKGYYKKNGTHVEGHYRTKPNKTKSDNFSTKGNINPYTGKKGTK